LTALEAAVSKTLAVTNNLAALEDTVGDRGVITHGSPLDESWQDECLSKLFQYMDGTLDKSTLVEKNYEWSQTLTWRGQAKKLADFVGVAHTDLEYCDMLNWTLDCPRDSKKDVMSVLEKLSPGSNILEIGTFVGTSLVGFLEHTKGTRATVIDTWTPYRETNQKEDTVVMKVDFGTIEETFYKNTERYRDRITVLKGSSREKLLELVVAQQKFEFVYIDGSHKCLDVYLDACLAWQLLSPGGYMVFDDYTFNKGDTLGSPEEAIEHFIREHKCKVVFKGYRVGLSR
jgi:predicted O-methyltransferase YrrM